MFKGVQEAFKNAGNAIGEKIEQLTSPSAPAEDPAKAPVSKIPENEPACRAKIADAAREYHGTTGDAKIAQMVNVTSGDLQCTANKHHVQQARQSGASR